MLDSSGRWALLNQVENVLLRTRFNPEDRFAGLSAGMKRRTFFERAFASKPELLLLDEPTNDLDAETLELLEELILEYQVTLLLVSHDRSFLNNVVTCKIVFEEDGQVTEYAGGYDDRTTTLKNTKKQYLLQGLGQNQLLTFQYDSV